MNGAPTDVRHPRVGGGPSSGEGWIPACAGMTKKETATDEYASQLGSHVWSEA